MRNLKMCPFQVSSLPSIHGVFQNTGIPSSPYIILREAVQEKWAEKSGSQTNHKFQKNISKKHGISDFLKKILNGILQYGNQFDLAGILASSPQDSEQWLHVIPVPPLTARY